MKKYFIKIEMNWNVDLFVIFILLCLKGSYSLIENMKLKELRFYV